MNGFKLAFVAVVVSGLLEIQVGSAQEATINLAMPPASLDVSPFPVKVVESVSEFAHRTTVVISGAGDGSNRLFVGSQFGQIYWIDQADTNVEEPNLFVDLSDRVEYKDRENEEGLLGLAFHPKFKTNGQFFVYYTTKSRPHVSFISRFTSKSDGHATADGKTEELLLEIPQPFWNHNGGTIAFGPDGYLYIALGDGGKANDPLKTGQRPNQPARSILRMMSMERQTESSKYAIPKDNPFVNQAGAQPEIYAKGIRNIWRMAFDPKTGQLWAADVGQNDWEEVNLIEKGGNYGGACVKLRIHLPLAVVPGRGRLSHLSIRWLEYPHTDDWVSRSRVARSIVASQHRNSMDTIFMETM